MLIELNISNFAIIDRLNLQLAPGLNAVTGETGAGKSIIVDALGILLGDKPDSAQIRSGEEQAHIEGVFDISGRAGCEEIRRLLGEYGLAGGEDLVILSRDLNATGRSIARVNGRVVNVDVLRDLGQRLVDIHSQSEHLSLMRVSSHVDLLDTYGGFETPRRHVASLVGELRQCRRELEALHLDAREVARRVDLLQYQLDEITAAKLQEGEDEQLEREIRVLSSAERLAILANEAYSAIYDGGSSLGGRTQGPAVLDVLAGVQKSLDEIAALDPSAAGRLEELNEAAALLEDLATSLRAYRDGVESDPSRLEQLDDRLNTIKELKRKYGRTIAEILAFQEQVAAELASISRNEEMVAELQEKERRLLGELAAKCAELSSRRRECALRLSSEVDRALEDLGMGGTRFEVYLATKPDPDGLEIGEERLAFDGKGVDRVEFMVSTNPGEPVRPLVKIASGGETSRLMLALKSVLSAADSTPTLVFDEIDVGVGGRSGQVVGEKLWSLSAGHQVLAITHLPQIAAFGDTHFQIQKCVKDGRTVTEVAPLKGDGRLRELAAMLEGTPESELSIESAKRMVERAQAWKLCYQNDEERAHCRRD